MDQNAVELMIAAMNLGAKALATYPAVRDALSAETRARADEAYADLTAQSNATADHLRLIPDDPT